MILYLEIQLQQAYRVYCSKIPMGQQVPEIEFFREMIETLPDSNFFESLLDEYEDLGSQKGTH
jgi:hypothetical protein